MAALCCGTVKGVGIASTIIAVGTGVKVYNWIFTMYGGRIQFSTPMLWAVGFIVTFVIGGIHLVFFLRITTAPDNTNNVLALAFGLLIVMLIVLGSLWIMYHLNHNMMPMDQMIHMQR